MKNSTVSTAETPTTIVRPSIPLYENQINSNQQQPPAEDHIDVEPIPMRARSPPPPRRPPPTPQSRVWSDHYYRPLIYPSSSQNLTNIIIGLNIGLFLIGLLFGMQYFLLNLLTLMPPYYFFHTLLTSLFLPDNIISMIFTVLIFWNVGRMYEKQFGPKFLAILYFLPGIVSLGVGLVFQYILLLSFGSTFVYGYSANGAIFQGLITFFCFFAGLETQLSFLLFFIPIRLKAKHILILIISLNVIFGLLGFVGVGDPIGSLMSLSGILTSWLIYKKLRPRVIPSQFL